MRESDFQLLSCSIPLEGEKARVLRLMCTCLVREVSTGSSCRFRKLIQDAVVDLKVAVVLQ